MICKLFKLKETSNKGIGLIANQLIPIGTIISFECENCQKLPLEQFNNLNMYEKKLWRRYAYQQKDKAFIMPCDEAKFLNHSCNANILDIGNGINIVVAEIQEGKEATNDYRVFYDDIKMKCYCGEPNCVNIVECIHPTPSHLKLIWQKKIDNALNFIHRVDQPLKNFINL